MDEKLTGKELVEKMNRSFDELMKRNDKANEEAEEKNGVATAETRASVEAIKEEIMEVRAALKEFEVRENRPNYQTQQEEETQANKIYKRAFDKYCRVGLHPDEDSAFKFTEEEKRGLSSWSDSSGGFLVPSDYEGGIIMNAYEREALRPICQTGTTSRDEVKLGALSKPSVAWSPAGIQISDEDLTAGIRRIRIYTLYGLTTVNNDTLDDAEANIEQELNDAFSMAIAEAEDNAYAAGAGDDSPQGVSANTDVQANYVATSVAAAIADATYNGMDALQSVMYTPKSTYRANGTWAMNSTTESLYLNLKNGEGAYLWQPNIIVGRPPTLFGKGIVNPEGMPDVAAGAFPVVFGDFMAGYKIRDNGGLSVMRLNEKYADYDQTGFMVKKRSGGLVTLPEAFACLKVAAS